MAAHISISELITVLTAVKNFILSKVGDVNARIDNLSGKVNDYACDEGSEPVSE